MKQTEKFAPKYSPTLAKSICDRVAAGESIMALCKDAGMPVPETVAKWRKNLPEFAAAMRAAQEASGQTRDHFVLNDVRWRFYNDVVVPYRGNECLAWPFSTKGSHGYGAIWETVKGPRKRNKVIYISRLLCELEHGPPPSDTHEAAHSCGRGKFGCVTRRHLSWKTVQENNWDKDAHGTRIWGENHPDAVLTAAQVLDIRARAAAGEKQCDLLREYGVAKATMSSIIRRKTWRRI